MKTFAIPSTDDLQLDRGLEREIGKAANDALMRIYGQREEVLRAFIAKYGFEHGRFVQVHQTFGTKTEWSVRRRSDEEMEQLSRMSSQL